VVRRGVAKVGHKWAISGCAGGGWQTVGSAPDDKSFHGVANGERGVLWFRFQSQKGNSGYSVGPLGAKTLGLRPRPDEVPVEE